jgi:hypothetical protein
VNMSATWPMGISAPIGVGIKTRRSSSGVHRVPRAYRTSIGKRSRRTGVAIQQCVKVGQGRIACLQKIDLLDGELTNLHLRLNYILFRHFFDLVLRFRDRLELPGQLRVSLFTPSERSAR